MKSLTVTSLLLTALFFTSCELNPGQVDKVEESKQSFKLRGLTCYIDRVNIKYSDEYSSSRDVIVCENTTITSEQHGCGKNCTEYNTVITKQLTNEELQARKKQEAISKLTEDERQLLGLK
jgi:hypothetical protein